MLYRSTLSLIGLVSFSLAGCAHGGSAGSGASPDSAVVRGTVTYRERMALPPEAVITVTLSDVSLMDAPAKVLAETTFTAGGKQVPFAFELKYDPASIKPQNTYAVRATILVDGKMSWTTDTTYPVITRESPNQVELLLKRVATPSAGAGDAGAAASGTLVGTSWRLEDLLGRGVAENAEATLEFPEEGRVAGKGSCNRFFGPAEIAGQSIKFSHLGSTMMACPEPIMNQEREYFKALESAERFEVQGSVLKIYCKGSDRPLRFSKQ
jgi:putative lipoprotein